MNFGFCSMREELPNFLFQHLEKFGQVMNFWLIMNPEYISHIYRLRDGFIKTGNPRKPVPFVLPNFAHQNMPFWCFPDYTWYSINCAIKREYFLSQFGEEKFGNPRVKVLPKFPFSEVNNLTSINSIMNHSFTLLLFIY